MILLPFMKETSTRPDLLFLFPPPRKPRAYESPSAPGHQRKEYDFV